MEALMLLSLMIKATDINYTGTEQCMFHYT